ncbi:MAG: porin [Caulobacteraceae bacterium]
MKSKATLVGSAALCAVLAVGMAGAANAKPVKHRRHREVRAASHERALRSEVDELKSEVQSLEGRLDAQAQAQQQAAAAQQAQIQAAQTQAAQSTAQAAQSTAQAAQSQVASQQAQIETIPAQVEAKTKPYEPLLSGWFNNTKIGGTVYTDLSYISNKNDGIKNSQSGPGFDIKRMYISIDHKFNNMFSANLTTDFTYDSTTRATQLYIKKAFLQANLLGNEFVIRAGSADMPWVPFVENLYGYRYVDHVLIDNYNYGTSADWGVHILGSLLDNHLGYQLSVVNGEGYKIAETGTSNRTNAMDVEGRVNVNYDHFTVAVGGYDGKLGHDVIGGAPAFNTAQRFDVIGAYTDKRFRLGVEYMYAKFWNDVTQTNPAKTNTSEGVSTFASWFFTPQLSIFGRYDWLQPQRDTNSNFHSNFYNIGLSYKPIGPLDFALVYKHDSVLDGLLSTQNGTIGTLHANLIGNGDYDEIGVFTQLKF